MINQYLSHNKHYRAAHHLLLACNALKSSIEEIRSDFSNNELTIVDLRHKLESEKFIEILLDPIWLHCFFDKISICRRTALIFDDTEDISYYIDCCNQAYPYDYLRREWVSEDYRISLQNDEEGFFLVFTSNLISWNQGEG